MGYILILETSAEICSVALSKEGKTIAEINSDQPNSHSELLAGFVKEILSENNISWAEIIAIAISGGPGSYTGLRIGASLAKGFCYARNLPLIAVNSLESIASKVKIKENQKVCALIDARRMDAYFAIVNHQYQTIKENDFTTLTSNFLQDFNLSKTDVFIGSATVKLNELYDNQLTILNGNLTASDSSLKAWEKFQNQEFESLAYYEPNYIKAVHITSKKQ